MTVTHLKAHKPKPKQDTAVEGPMRKVSFKLLTLATICAGAVLIQAQTTEDETTLKQIAAYRQWQRINAEPIILTGLGSLTAV